MQVVIEIPEEKFEWIKNHEAATDFQLTQLLYSRVRKGTPLPKGHGRLIECERLQEVFRRNVVGYAGFKKLFDIAPTIIEADKTESEG